jgi:S-(hydroxymethyl)glutathione dehydrogenase/alcohol dehydrogenase
MMDGTTRLSVDGDPIYHYCSLACFAEQVVVPVQCCVPMPRDIPFSVLALIGCAVSTGVGSVLNTAKVTPGSSVAVYGVGGVGLSTVLGARVAGASTIIAIDLSPERREAALALGATHALAAGPGVVDEIRRLTEGRGADYVFEAAGLTRLQEEAVEAARPGGTVVYTGLSGVETVTHLSGARITRQEKTIMGSYYGTANPARDFPRFGEMYLNGRLDLDRMITKTYPLEQINEAYQDLIAGRGARGVVEFLS